MSEQDSEQIYYKEYSRTPLIERIYHAMRGVRNAWEKEPNFRIQILAALLVFVAMLILPLSNIERAVLVVIVTLVLALEAINSIFERVLNVVHPQFSEEIKKIKDTMAGVVFLASGASIVIGLLVLTRPILHFDTFVQGALDPFRTSAWVKTAEVVTRFGDWQMVLYLSILALGYLAYKKRWEMFTFFAGSIAGAQAMILVLKFIFERERPIDTDLFGALGYSFPSGHVLGGAVLYFAIAFILNKKMGHGRYVWAFATVVVFMISLSRVALSVHWFSDITGGLILAIFWLLLWYGVNERLWEKGISSLPE